MFNETKFWSKVSEGGQNDCWNWLASKDKAGYGKININSVHYRAHRIAYQLANGAFDLTLKVCHSCDNPSCCNPNHLFLGTDKDNHQDKVNKGRQHRMFGKDNPRSKLSEEQIEFIRKQPFKHGLFTELGQKFGVSQPCISMIWHGKRR